MSAFRNCLPLCVVAAALTPVAIADTLVNQDTQADLAFAKYGATGKGVIVAIMDRGVDYTHPDFRNADGTTRIKLMWDMSGQNGCDSNNPAPVVYTEAEINAALASGGTPLAERDAVGHGTVTTGIAAGNGSALGKASAQYAGIAPDADLLIAKVTSEGAPAHGNQAAEAPFLGCLNQALDLVTGEAATLGEPIVGLINSGTQWGPIDGTSTVSREIDLDFGLDSPGRIYTEASGDEGTYKNHARSTYTKQGPHGLPLHAVLGLHRRISGLVQRRGGRDRHDHHQRRRRQPHFGAEFLRKFGGSEPRDLFLPSGSAGLALAILRSRLRRLGVRQRPRRRRQRLRPGHAIGHRHRRCVRRFGRHHGLHQVPDGRPAQRLLFDVLGSGCRLLQRAHPWTDINGNQESLTNEGGKRPVDGLLRRPHTRWSGTTRRRRRHHHAGRQSVRRLRPQQLLGDFSVQFDPRRRGLLWPTKRDQRCIADSYRRDRTHAADRSQAHGDPGAADRSRYGDHRSFTGATPNELWGLGKLNILGSLDATAALLNTAPSFNASSLNFGTQKVGTESAAQNIVLSNGGTDPMGIGSIVLSGNSYVITKKTCGTSPAGKRKMHHLGRFQTYGDRTQTGGDHQGVQSRRSADRLFDRHGRLIAIRVTWLTCLCPAIFV